MPAFIVNGGASGLDDCNALQPIKVVESVEVDP